MFRDSRDGFEIKKQFLRLLPREIVESVGSVVKQGKTLIIVPEPWSIATINPWCLFFRLDQENVRIIRTISFRFIFFAKIYVFSLKERKHNSNGEIVYLSLFCFYTFVFYLIVITHRFN